MARKKKPVDRTPLCDPAYLRRIDPVWLIGRVPPRFWEDGTHRRDYLLWFARRVGFRTMEDLYRLNVAVCYKAANRGRGLMAYWGTSAVDAVQDCFPQYDWKPWLFMRVPNGFWDSLVNRRSYLDWLGQRLGYRCMDDWHGVTIDDFRRNGGNGLMAHYSCSPIPAVIGLIPEHNWCEWKFDQLPRGFWEAAENRHRYLRWLGKELGFRRPEDWYRIRAEDIARRHGTNLLHRYSSLYDLMREFLPELDWDRVDRHRPIQVDEVLAWADAHHAKHGTWPDNRSGEIPGIGQTWQGINHCLRSGYRGMPGGGSLAKLLEEHRGVRVGRTPPGLSEEQILAWADAYFATQGKWPQSSSGPIPGTRETWCAVVHALHNGGRGCPGGLSLAQLLAQRRGVRNRTSLPRLSEQRILAWAKAYFKAKARWPSVRSEPVAQSAGETWTAIDQALRKGVRGLPGGSSLARLLRKHGLK